MDRTTPFGPYELLSRLSAGGMAEVFRARDTRDGAIVALKRILPSIAEDEEFLTMFEDEARIAAELEHPHIARLLDFGSVDGANFIAYELVDGRDLRVVFENASLTGERPPLPVTLYVFCRIGEGLAYAHARRDTAGAPKSIVHRDVSPQNIVLSFAGDVKLIDFGIAKAKGKLSRTAVGTIKGKFGYMSPEQVRGAPIDQRTDVFSLGICMWELLTLKRLFTGPNEILILDMVKRRVPEPPSAFAPGVPPELDRIVLKALAKNPDERYRSARALTKDLYAFVEKSGAIATREHVARYMRETFPGAPRDLAPPRSTSEQAGRGGSTPQSRSVGRIMELQETRMSDENKGGSDLDIFEGLGKKSSGRTSAVPPPPPGSGSHVAAARPAGNAELKRTMIGIPGPANSSQSAIPAAPPPSNPPPLPSAPPASGSMRAAPPASPSKPPPPPGRGSLPNLAAAQPSSSPSQSNMPAVAPSATQKVPSQVPPPASTRPGPAGAAAPTSTPTQPAQPAANGRQLDMDWDDDNEATHVFDKESRDKERVAADASGNPLVVPEAKPAERASMDEILSSPPPRSSNLPAAGTPPPPAPTPATATLSGAFGALGQTNGSAPSGQFKSGPPPSQSMRSAPPPPPASMRQPNPSTSTAPIPPPPPPGQTTTAPMHMPPRPASVPPQGQVPSAPPGSMPPVGSVPPQHASHPPQASQPPMPQMPPVSRAMEATALVPRKQESKAGLWVGLLLGVCAAVGIAVFFLLPRTGTLVVNVADNKGAAVSKLEVHVDGTKRCDSAPCIVPEMSAGVHQVKVVAPGYEQAAARAVTIEGRRDATVDFTLVAAKAAGGTGVRVAGTQPGVKLWVDGKEIGTLPQEVRDLEPGEHTIKLAGDRYAPVEKTVSVAKDEMVEVKDTLKVTKGKATIQLGTPGAKVYLVSGTNRKEVPQFPIAIDFDPNEAWELQAKKDGYEEYRQPIRFDDGIAEKTFTITLDPKGAAAPAVAPAPKPVAAPAAEKPAAAPAAKPAAAPAEKPAAAPAAKPEPKAPAAAAGEAFLNINSLPASTVVLDGKPLGPTPKLKVPVSAGTHTILFVNSEQSLKKAITVTVAAGETKAAFAKLRD